jgi:hypothetical protein
MVRLLTKLFISSNSMVETARRYQDFIKENQSIKIVSVNATDTYILLTYYTGKEDLL